MVVKIAIIEASFSQEGHYYLSLQIDHGDKLRTHVSSLSKNPVFEPNSFTFPPQVNDIPQQLTVYALRIPPGKEVTESNAVPCGNAVLDLFPNLEKSSELVFTRRGESNQLFNTGSLKVAISSASKQDSHMPVPPFNPLAIPSSRPFSASKTSETIFILVRSAQGLAAILPSKVKTPRLYVNAGLGNFLDHGQPCFLSGRDTKLLHSQMSSGSFSAFSSTQTIQNNLCPQWNEMIILTSSSSVSLQVKQEMEGRKEREVAVQLNLLHRTSSSDNENESPASGFSHCEDATLSSISLPLCLFEYDREYNLKLHFTPESSSRSDEIPSILVTIFRRNNVLNEVEEISINSSVSRQRMELLLGEMEFQVPNTGLNASIDINCSTFAIESELLSKKKADEKIIKLLDSNDIPTQIFHWRSIEKSESINDAIAKAGRMNGRLSPTSTFMVLPFQTDTETNGNTMQFIWKYPVLFDSGLGVLTEDDGPEIIAGQSHKENIAENNMSCSSALLMKLYNVYKTRDESSQEIWEYDFIGFSAVDIPSDMPLDGQIKEWSKIPVKVFQKEGVGRCFPGVEDTAKMNCHLNITTRAWSSSNLLKFLSQKESILRTNRAALQYEGKRGEWLNVILKGLNRNPLFSIVDTGGISGLLAYEKRTEQPQTLQTEREGYDLDSILKPDLLQVVNTTRNRADVSDIVPGDEQGYKKEISSLRAQVEVLTSELDSRQHITQKLMNEVAKRTKALKLYGGEIEELRRSKHAAMKRVESLQKQLKGFVDQEKMDGERLKKFVQNFPALDSLSAQDTKRLVKECSKLHEKYLYLQGLNGELQKQASNSKQYQEQVKTLMKEKQQIEQAHTVQSKYIQKFQHEHQNIEVYKKTIQTQERVIRKLEDLIETKVARIQTENNASAESNVHTEIYRLREENKALRQQTKLVRSHSTLEAPNASSSVRIRVLEEQLVLNAEEFAAEIAELRMRVFELEMGVDMR